MNFDLTDLRAFLAVADLGSFRAAAYALHLTQPALSRRVDKLEQALGFRLFDRTTRRVELNAMGRNFLPRARHVLNELDSALLGMADLSDRMRGRVGVACIPSVVATFVADAVREFHGLYPRIRLQIIDESATDILGSVVRGDADFGISYLGTQEPDLAFEPLFDEEFVLACPLDHALARRRHVTWSELAAHDGVMLSMGTGNRMLVDQALAASSDRMAWSCEVRHVPALLSLIEAGVGIGAAPRFALSTGERARLACVPLTEPKVARTIGLIARRGRPLSAAAQAFQDILTRRIPKKRAGRATGSRAGRSTTGR